MGLPACLMFMLDEVVSICLTKKLKVEKTSGAVKITAYWVKDIVRVDIKGVKSPEET